MTIVNLSLPTKMIEEMEQLQETGGYSSGSQLVRVPISLTLDHIRQKESLAGRVEAITIVTNAEFNEAPIIRLKHQFEDILKTYVHNRISQGNCVEFVAQER